MTQQRLCKKLCDTLTQFYSNSTTDYDKHKSQCQDIYSVDGML